MTTSCTGPRSTRVTRDAVFALLIIGIVVSIPSTARAGGTVEAIATIETVVAAPGSTATVDVTLDTSVALAGWSFGVCLDDALFAPSAVTLGSALPPLAFSSAQIHAAGVTQAAIVDFALAQTLPTGLHTLLSIEGTVLAGDGVSVPLVFCDTISTPPSPPVTIEFLAGATAVSTNLIDGSITVVDCAPVPDLTAESLATGIALSWTNPGNYDSLVLLRDGAPYETLDPLATMTSDTPTIGSYAYQLVATCPGGTTVMSDTVLGHVVAMELPNAAADVGDTPSIAVSLDFRAGEVNGIAFGVAHDPTRLTPVSVVASGALAAARGGLGPDMFLTQTFPGGVTVAAVLATSAPFEGILPSVPPLVEVVQIDYTVAPGPTGVFPLIFDDGFGSPAVSREVVVGMDTVVPMTTDGSIAITGDGAFLRGDVNGDGQRNLTDAIVMLYHLFRAGGAVPVTCDDAVDVNDSGVLEISDVISLLEYFFAAGSPPPAPFGACDLDPTLDTLTCAFDSCQIVDE